MQFVGAPQNSFNANTKRLQIFCLKLSTLWHVTFFCITDPLCWQSNVHPGFLKGLIIDSYGTFFVNNPKTLLKKNCIFTGDMKHVTTHCKVLDQWASYQIRKIAGCACAGNTGNVSPRRRFQRNPLVSDPGMHHGTCVTHVPGCMSGSLTCGDGENVPGIPGACAPAILRIWQEAHCLGLETVSYGAMDPQHKALLWPRLAIYLYSWNAVMTIQWTRCPLGIVFALHVNKKSARWFSIIIIFVSYPFHKQDWYVEIRVWEWKFMHFNSNFILWSLGRRDLVVIH